MNEEYKKAVARCNVCPQLRREYENALKFEAIAYGKLIAHRRRHQDASKSQRAGRVHYLRLVNKVARRYEEGDVETLAEIPPA